MSWNAARSAQSARVARSHEPLERRFKPTPLQDQFLNDVFSGKWRFFGLGGAIRGGKTLAVVQCIFLLCKLFPGSKWAIVRKDLPRLKKTIIPTIEQFRPRDFVGKLNKADWVYTCTNGSQIILFPEQLSTDPDLDRFKGLAVNGFAIEEANEIAEMTFNKCKERLGSWIIQPTREYPHPEQPPALILCTFNPADNWVRGTFYDPWRNNTIRAPYRYTPALPKDNPYNTDEQRAAWAELPPEQYKRFIEGDWEAITDPRQLLTYQQIIDAAYVEERRGRKREGLDVASGGDSETGKHDDTVFALIDGNVIDGSAPFLERQNGWSEPTIALRARARMNLFGVHPSDYIIDSAPAGAYNILRRWGLQTKAFVAGAAAVPRFIQPISEPVSMRDRARGITRPQPKLVASAFTFENLRAQAWYEFAEGVKNGKYCILNPSKEMIRDLTAPRYDFRSEFKVKVSSRDEIIDMTGHSPDVGTAIIMGTFEFPKPAKIKVAPTGALGSLR